MGIYVNPRNVLFRKALNGDIYIDKTDLIAHTNDKIDKLLTCWHHITAEDVSPEKCLPEKRRSRLKALKGI